MTKTHWPDEDNMCLVRDYVETWNRGDVEGLPRFWSEDMIHHTRSQHQNVGEVKRVISEFMTAFPDINFAIDDIFATEGRVVTRMTAQATHKGPFLGFEPTGKSINCAVIGIARVENGKIAEHWGVTDELAMMAQIGILPTQFLESMM